MNPASQLLRRTRRLEIRPLRLGDYGRWHATVASAPRKRNRWDSGTPEPEKLTRAGFAALLRDRALKRAADDFYTLGVFRRDTREYIGSVSVMNVVRGVTHSAYLGYFLDARHWGKGFGKEAVRALIDIAFRGVRLHRVEAGVEPGNIRSIRLARALGLRKEGLKKRVVFLRGRWQDLIMYSATCDEFGVRWKNAASSSRMPARSRH